MEDPERFNEFKEHEKVQQMLNGIRVNTLDASVEIIQSSDELKNDYEKASSFILAAIGRHHEKYARTGKARNISTTGTRPTNNSWNPGKGDKNQPWVNKNGICDFRGIKEGKFDKYLDNFTFKDGYSTKEWKSLHPMVKRKKFLSRGDGGKKRSVNEVQIEDIELLKSAREHDKVCIASLRRKLDRATREKYRLRGQNFSDDEDLLGSDEDPSVVTEVSNPAVRNSLKKTGKKRTRFKLNRNDD